MDVRAIIKESGISPFGAKLTRKNPAILKTRDSRKVHEKLRKKLTSPFVFSATDNILDAFHIPADEEEIKGRQEFFSQAPSDNQFLKKLKSPKPSWRPPYAIIAVTEDESMYSQLKSMGVPVSLLLSENDITELQDYEIVQAIECEKFNMHLEQLENVIFFDSPEEIFLERFLKQLSGWEENIKVLEGHMDVKELKDLLNLLETKNIEFSQEDAEHEVEKINASISEKLKSRKFQGSDVFEMLDSGSLPDEMKEIVQEELNNTNLPREVFIEGIPVRIDYEQLEKEIKNHEASIHLSFAERLKKNKEKLKQVPKMLRDLEVEILYRDFCSIISVVQGNFPSVGQLQLKDCRNPLLSNPEPVSFYLDENNKCSILTGANSGGKTTLIEHVIQVVIMGQLGLPVDGEATIPQFKEIFYFAKNKGALNQGAFETLLNQMASIKRAENPLVLADEIESITEPGVAAEIISASAEYFVNKGFHLIFATHLGREIQHSLPEKSRIDGIEAEGLDEKFNLIIKRSPVLGKLASSTPELIIKRLSQKTDDDYFNFLAKQITKPFSSGYQ